MEILILGSRGNLGGQLVKVFKADKEYEVVAWDREEIDITDKGLVFKKIRELKPDIIINATAYNAVDKCEEDEKEFTLAKKINAEAVGYLVEACLEVDAVLIHYSSDYVFAGDRKEGYKEDDKPDPINKYGETKLAGEEELIKKSGQGLKYYLIRTSKLFGPRGEGELTKPSFFDLMLDLAKKKKELDVVNEEVSCFTYTPDLARATKKLLESDKGYGIYHITNVGRATWHEAAAELFKIIGKKIKINPVKGDKFPRPARRPAYSVLINTKFDMQRDWKEALKEYLKK
ncbi:MAG: dTDP-4-dehydrorhamnose reductase [Patescibacteria group bacterium]|nr:dTDP-4-dehydrorhamnose reductase [Patescibacteria group bacterium]MDD5294727.1 dTDP-4-dehydrorhamnose reductase [Patescibacteria group bacterium]MDD5554957.1 dTDP-4-dehydrorhamnose reductase [Patescibacteria group bacterium]